MNEKDTSEVLACEVIEDLLPNYIDKLTSEKTNSIIKHHLDNCESCRAKYLKMTNQFDNIKKDNKTENNIEIDYLKKVKTKNDNKVKFAVAITFLIIAVGILYKLFVYGFPTTSYKPEIAVNDNKILITGSINDSSLSYSHYRVKDNKITVYGCFSSWFNEKSDFNIEYKLSSKDVSINGNTIKPDGSVISDMAYKLYQCKNQYIGNVPADSNLVYLLGIPQYCGHYLFELNTDKEPYSMTLVFQDDMCQVSKEKTNVAMKDYAVALLSLIENCDIITWEYMSDRNLSNEDFKDKYSYVITQDDGEEITSDEPNEYTITVSDGENNTETHVVYAVDSKIASHRLGNDVKSYADSPEKIQEMLNLLNIK